MCDCYVHKCEKCDEVIPMHLEDFSTGREEIEVYCDRHLPEDQSDGMLWKWSESKVKEPKRFQRCFIRWLTENAKHERYGNEPNTWHCDILSDPTQEPKN